MPFDTNRTLSSALDQPTPVVLRNYEVMMAGIKAFVAELNRAVENFLAIDVRVRPHEHSDTCEACTIVRNVQLRFQHDLSLLGSQARIAGELETRISKVNSINHASAEDLLNISLISRAALDNLIRSCALFMQHDIRAYNKHLAESLTSIQKLVWTTLPHSIASFALPLLDSYQSLSGSKRNDSALFADPFPTFSRKIEFLKGLSKDEGVNPLFDMVSEIYGALSDLVHGGIASLAVASPDNPQIVIGRAPLQYTPYTYQVAELLGISLIATLKTFTNLYVPALIQSLAWMEGTIDITEQLMMEHSAMAERLKDATF